MAIHFRFENCKGKSIVRASCAAIIILPEYLKVLRVPYFFILHYFLPSYFPSNYKGEKKFCAPICVCSEFNNFSHAAGIFRKQARPLNYLFFPKPEEKYAKESQTKYCNVCRHMTKRKFRVHDILAIDVVFRKYFAFLYFPLYLRPHAIIKRRGSE